MRRDNDFIRTLLFKYENETDWLLMEEGDTIGAFGEERREQYHMHLMMDEGLLCPVGRGTFRMTSYGHDYLDAIRDDTIWNKTKVGAAKVGGASLKLVFDIATTYVKQKASEIVGAPL